MEVLDARMALPVIVVSQYLRRYIRLAFL